MKADSCQAGSCRPGPRPGLVRRSAPARPGPPVRQNRCCALGSGFWNASVLSPRAAPGTGRVVLHCSLTLSLVYPVAKDCSSSFCTAQCWRASTSYDVQGSKESVGHPPSRRLSSRRCSPLGESGRSEELASDQPKAGVVGYVGVGAGEGRKPGAMAPRVPLCKGCLADPEIREHSTYTVLPSGFRNTHTQRNWTGGQFLRS